MSSGTNFAVVHRMASQRAKLPVNMNQPVHPHQVEHNHLSSDSSIADALACAFSYDTDVLAVGTTKGGVKLLHGTANFRPSSFELTSAMCRGEAMRSAVTCCRFRPGFDRGTKDLLLVGNTDGSISEWHLGSAQMVFSDTQPGTEIYAVDYEPTGAFFCSAGKDTFVRLYDSARKCNMTTLRQTVLSDTSDAHSNRVQAVRWIDSNTILSGGWDQTVQMWDVRQQKAVNRIFGPYLCGDGLDAHGAMIVTASTRPTSNLQMWDSRSLKPLCEFRFPDAPSTSDSVEPYASNLFAAKFSPDGRYLAAGGSLDFRVFDVKRTFAEAKFAPGGGGGGGDAAAEPKSVTPVDCGRVLHDGGVNAAVFSIAWGGNSTVAAVGYGCSLNVLRSSG